MVRERRLPTCGRLWLQGVVGKGAVSRTEGFATWTRRSRDESDPTVPCVAGRVPTSYWWIVEGDIILGAIALRHRLNDRLLRVLGQIGHGIRPSARQRGLATWALGQVLSTARATYGLDRVLIVRDEATSCQRVSAARVCQAPPAKRK